MTHPSDILPAESSVSFPKQMKYLSVLLGVFLMAEGVRGFVSPSGKGAYLAFPYFLVGAVCMYIFGYDRRLFLDREGVVRETAIWGRVLRDVTPWSSIVGISMTPAKGKVLAFFRKGTTGWRMRFSSEEELRSFLEDVAPDVPME